jgi:hypothetical protein
MADSFRGVTGYVLRAGGDYGIGDRTCRQYIRPRLCRLGTRKPSSIPRPLRAALHRVDQEIQHMLENTRLLAKAA